MPAFIETQFPIARLSAESYKERKAATGQTLPEIGKWWGRKPLILVRACLIGMLMPSSDDHKKDRDVFLRLLTMDDQAVWDRCKDLHKRKLAKTYFDSLPYAERISFCERPENVVGPSEESWETINKHLGTNADSLTQLIGQLGINVFGHHPRLGDSFCGGGSIPFEASRIGFDVFGSDLNPVASLITWASLNILGGGNQLVSDIVSLQDTAFKEADKEVCKWGIEHNDSGERADAFLYCVEVKPDGSDYFIPLSPNWVISEKHRIVVFWERQPDSNKLKPKVVSVDECEFSKYEDGKGATISNGRVIDPFDQTKTWSIESLRGPSGNRKWTNDDLVPRPEDVFQERLYCIRWINSHGMRRYAAPDEADHAREEKALNILRERFDEWQHEGFIPSKTIESGHNTDQPIRERGWTHWHHLFTPRQLLINGLISYCFRKLGANHSLIASFLNVSRIANANSRLCSWKPSLQTNVVVFYNQALNTLYNYSTRGLHSVRTAFVPFSNSFQNISKHTITSSDARDIRETCDIWITDPPYADAVNYHELGDFFLAWYDKQLAKVFPEWVPDARAELAVRGDGEDFRRSMVEIYQNLARHMPDNGMQMVMFTHQDPGVWADLGMILWAAGLKATAAWTISTETEAAGIKKGNYVQGTVCLVLRKRTANEPGFLDEVYPLVEDEVKRQIASMQALDEGGEPNFNDADYQLAAYAAALKVLTQYGNLDGKEVEHEVFAVRAKNQKSDFQAVIERALGIACDTLIPRGLDNSWRDLSLVERYYLRALDIESRGERRQGMYEELARGFGVTEIKPLLKNDKANGARMLTPTGFAAGLLGPINGTPTPVTESLPPRRGRAGSGALHPFAGAPLRHLLYAIRETTATDNSPEPGRQYLRDTFGQGYWSQRERFVALLEWLAALGNAEGMTEWVADSEAARILSGRLRNDHA